MICTNCFEAEMIETTAHVECIGTVPCWHCPECEYIIFDQNQSDIIDKMRRERDTQVHDLMTSGRK